MAALTINNLTEGNGTDIAFEAAAGGGDTYTWSKNTVCHVKNGSESPITVTIAPASSTFKQQGVGALSKATIAFEVGDGEEAILDTRSQAFQGANGNVSVSYSDVTSVTVAAIRWADI